MSTQNWIGVIKGENSAVLIFAAPLIATLIANIYELERVSIKTERCICWDQKCHYFEVKEDLSWDKKNCKLIGAEGWCYHIASYGNEVCGYPTNYSSRYYSLTRDSAHSYSVIICKSAIKGIWAQIIGLFYVKVN